MTRVSKSCYNLNFGFSAKFRKTMAYFYDKFKLKMFLRTSSSREVFREFSHHKFKYLQQKKLILFSTVSEGNKTENYTLFHPVSFMVS